MSISRLMQDMADKGASLDVILMAVRAVEAEQQKIADTRAQAAARKRRQRERGRDSHATVAGLSEDKDGQTPSPDKSPPYPQKLTPNPGVCDAPTRETDPVGEIIAAWNAMAKRAGLPQVSKLTVERKRRLCARLAEHDADAFTEAIAAVERSSFCRGASDGGWRANFDFLLQPSSFTKLLEGAYDRPASRNGSSQSRFGGSTHPGGRIGAASDRVFGGLD